MIGGFNTTKFNERVFNDSLSKYIVQTENVLVGANRFVMMMSGKFVALIKAFVRKPSLKFRVNDND